MTAAEDSRGTAARAAGQRGVSLGPTDAAPVLDALRQPIPDVQVAAVECLTWLPLTDEVWRGAEDSVVQVLARLLAPSASEEDRRSAIRAGAGVPLPAVRALLLRFAGNRNDPAWSTALFALAAVGEKRTVPILVELVRSDDSDHSAPAVAALAKLPIETLQVDPTVFTAALQSSRPDVRMWAAIAVARLGDVAFLEREGSSWEQNPDGRPYLFSGSPWTAYAELAAVRPVPASLADWLRRHEESLGIVAWALTGDKDAEGSVVEDLEPRDQHQTDEGGTLDGDVDLSSGMVELTPEVRSRLRRADRKTVEEFVERALTQAGRRRTDDPMDHLMGSNELVERLLAVPPHAVPLERLLVYSFDSSSLLDHRQVAHFAARSGLDASLQAVGSMLSNVGTDGKLKLMRFLQDVGQETISPSIPFRGAAGASVTTRHVEPLEGDVLPKWDDPSIWEMSWGVEGAIDDLREAGTEPPPAQPATATRQAWPRIDCDSEVGIDEEFEALLGLRADQDRSLRGTGAMEVPAAAFELVVELVGGDFEPSDGQRRISMTVSPADPYPTRAMTLRPTRSVKAENRRIAVVLWVGKEYRGYAERPVRVRGGADGDPPVSEDPPEARPIDLRPAPPPDDAEALARSADLTLQITRGSHEGKPALWWTAASPHAEFDLDNGDRLTELDLEPERFATLLKSADKSQTPSNFYVWLEGAGRSIAELIPRGVWQALREVAALDERPITVLLVSAEAAIPWELAYVEPPLPGTGNASPFLCSQVAIGRWITNAHHQEPPNRAMISSAAIVAADYEGGGRWQPLPAALAEAQALAAAWDVPINRNPSLEDLAWWLRRCSSHLLHMALHGSYDAAGLTGGLVLVRPNPGPKGGVLEEYLTAQHVNAAVFDGRPFVFLNACEAARNEELLGTYSGLVASFIARGASAVVAPLWTVDDSGAAAFAKRFYAAVLPGDDDGGPAGETLRKERPPQPTKPSDVTPASVSMLAYQFFGHPSLRLRYVPAPPPVSGEG